MSEAVSSTSPLLYLFRIGAILWLPELFTKVIVPEAVASEFDDARTRGLRAPRVADYVWIQIVRTSPSSSYSDREEWDAIQLALEGRGRIVLLDDASSREFARIFGLETWGTLRVILEAKARGLTHAVEPFLDRLDETGLSMTAGLRRRILRLAAQQPT